jgi:hypothetical protein
MDYNITPQFSIQYYGSPFVSKGIFSELKYITDPENKEYHNRFEVYKSETSTGNEYYLDENNDGMRDYTIENPDFNFIQFRSNLVAKWEYRPGSLIYLVWSSDHTGDTSPVDVPIGDSLRQIWDIFPTNIFLIKFSYWFSI